MSQGNKKNRGEEREKERNANMKGEKDKNTAHGRNGIGREQEKLPNKERGVGADKEVR